LINRKKKILYKQNILALCKQNITDSKIILYKDPSNIAKYTTESIDDENIKNFINKNTDNSINEGLKELKKKYDELKNTNITTIHENQQQQEEQQQEEQLLKQNEKNTVNLPLFINYNLENIGKNKIVLLNKYNGIIPEIYCILYDNNNNNIIILEIINIKYIFEYNDNKLNENITIISFNNKQFGKEIDNKLMKYIIMISKININNIYNNYNKKYNISSDEKLLENSEDYKKFIETYNLLTEDDYDYKNFMDMFKLLNDDEDEDDYDEDDYDEDEDISINIIDI